MRTFSLPIFVIHLWHNNVFNFYFTTNFVRIVLLELFFCYYYQDLSIILMQTRGHPMPPPVGGKGRGWKESGGLKTKATAALVSTLALQHPPSPLRLRHAPAPRSPHPLINLILRCPLLRRESEREDRLASWVTGRGWPAGDISHAQNGSGERPRRTAEPSQTTRDATRACVPATISKSTSAILRTFPLPSSVTPSWQLNRAFLAISFHR